MTDFDSLGENFDPREHSGRSPLQPGTYPFRITYASVGLSKNGKSKRLELRLEGCEGSDAAGHRARDYIVTQHSSERVMSLAKTKLSGLFIATGTDPKPKSASELIGKEIRARTAIEPANGQYPASTKVMEYFSPDDEADFSDM